jgi:hypothetical protein
MATQIQPEPPKQEIFSMTNLSTQKQNSCSSTRGRSVALRALNCLLFGVSLTATVAALAWSQDAPNPAPGANADAPAVTSNDAAVTAERETHHALTATVSPDVFCSFLPPNPGGNIADSESDAVVFCNKPSSQAPNANIFPPGFIKSAHFAKGPGFVQVTGRIDRQAYRLSANDGGGQYDSNGVPPGARVTGAKKFVNLVEPDVQDFCIRACTDPSKCNIGESTKGCKIIVPGDYN